MSGGTRPGYHLSAILRAAVNYDVLASVTVLIDDAFDALFYEAHAVENWRDHGDLSVIARFHRPARTRNEEKLDSSR